MTGRSVTFATLVSAVTNGRKVGGLWLVKQLIRGILSSTGLIVIDG